MEYSPQPMFENERTGLSRECDASIVVAGFQRLFDLLKEGEDGQAEE